MISIKQVFKWRLTEMPHQDINSPSPLKNKGDNTFYNTVDFQIEKYSVSQEEKRKLMAAFNKGGFVAFSKKGGGWLFFSSGQGGLPQLALATKQQVDSLPHLPDNWEELMVNVD